MRYSYSRRGLDGREKTLEKIFEILPGAVSWTLLAGLCLLSYARPLAAAVIIIAFYLYWVLRLFYTNFFLVLSYLRLWLESDTDWLARIREVDAHGEPQPAHAGRSWKKRVSRFIHLRKLAGLTSAPPHSSGILHLVIIPVANETAETIEPGIESLSRSSFPPRQIIVILTIEERAPEGARNCGRGMKDKYGSLFRDFIVLFHPYGAGGEAPVKGANSTFAGRYAADYLKERDIGFERVIVSCFDADTVVGEDYFSCLTYYFLVSPCRSRASFQPIPVYHNNIWKAPGFSRILDIGSSFFQLVETTNPEQLVSFSSHSISLCALHSAGYWPVDMISDDSAIFWKAFIHFDGDYRVVPIYTTISMDVTSGKNWLAAFRNVYKQKRRWAWGIENFPIVMRAFIRDRNIPFMKKFRNAFRLFEGFVSWATWSFILAIIGWLPLLFAQHGLNGSLFYYSAPRIKFIIFSLAFTGLAICVTLSFLLLPREKTEIGMGRKLLHVLEWLTVPLVTIFLGAAPALDAQTRLMAGKYLEFFITPKIKEYA